MNARFLPTLSLGFLIGIIVAFVGFSFMWRDPVMSCTGKVRLDTATHEDMFLNNAIYMAESDAPMSRLYLQFRESKTMNEALGKKAKVTGTLRLITLDDGSIVHELKVQEIQYLPGGD